MLKREEDMRGSVEFVNIEAMVPADHLLRKIDIVLDFTHIYDFTEGLYSRSVQCG